MNSISFFKALLMKEIDEELKGGQKKLDVAEPKGKLTKADFEKLGNMKKEVDTPSTPSTYSGTTPKGLGPIVDMEEGEDHEVDINPSNQTMTQKIRSIKAILKKYPQAKIEDLEKDREQITFTIVVGNMNRNEYSELINKLEKAIGEDDAITSDYEDGKIYVEVITPYTGKDESKVMKEGGDHEVSMAHNSLESIIKSAMELKMKLGDDERDIPGWIQDHITNAENYIDQAAQGFHELHGGEEDMDKLPDGTEELPAGDEEDYMAEGVSIDIPEGTDYKEFAMAVANILKNDYGTHNYEPFMSALSSELSKEEEAEEELSLESMMEDLFEAKKKKPSAGLSKKQKSAISKKAKSGKDIGKKGKGFEKIASKAAKKYGSKERGQAVAAAAMWKSAAKKAK